jgi:type II secretory pathway predicted ATPase ExeA
VVRAATERALAALSECACEPARPAVLVGPPGTGKSLLLRLAAERLVGTHGIEARAFLDYPLLDIPGLCMWVFDGIRSPHFEDPVYVFESYLGHLRAKGSSLLLVIDDLSGMPLETVNWLARHAAASKGELRLIAAALDLPSAYERIARLGPACETILMDFPMQAEESSEYVRERLRHADAPERTQARFDPATVSELHRISGGNPRELNTAAATHLGEYREVRVRGESDSG